MLLVSVVGVLMPASLRAAAWPVENAWDAREEAAFSTWVARIGVAEAHSINVILRDPQRNSLYDESDLKLALYADCADLPVMLRAYYAYKRRLPFAVTEVGGGRYTLRGNTTVSLRDNLSFEGSAQAFLTLVPSVLHTGNYRTEPESRDSLTYPIAINRQTLRPGALFYSPEGHAAIVVKVQTDGTLYLLDAHPDQTVTRIRFSPKLEWRTTARVGGFKAFRRAAVRGKAVILMDSDDGQPGFSEEQYGFEAAYYDLVQQRLSLGALDALEAFDACIMKDVYAEVLDRVQAVAVGWAVGRERSIPTPGNIYATEGDWENFSSPSRDLRLRRAFLQVPEEARKLIRLAAEHPERLRHPPKNLEKFGRRLLERKEELFRQLKFSYANSEGREVKLTLADLESRLFRLSFNPNHPPELRWGAQGRELATAPRSPARYFESYEREQPWRNRLEKKYNAMSPEDADNPASPPPHDLSLLIRSILAEETKPR